MPHSHNWMLNYFWINSALLLLSLFFFYCHYSCTSLPFSSSMLCCVVSCRVFFFISTSFNGCCRTTPFEIENKNTITMLHAWFLTPSQWKKERKKNDDVRTSTSSPLFLMNLTDWLGQKEIKMFWSLSPFSYMWSIVFVSTNYNVNSIKIISVPSHTQCILHWTPALRLHRETITTKEWKEIEKKKRNWHHVADNDQYIFIIFLSVFVWTQF